MNGQSMGDNNASDNQKTAAVVGSSDRSSSKEKRRVRRDSAKDKHGADSHIANGGAVPNVAGKRGGKIGDRKSRSIYGRGLPKKQGGGGKGTWGRLGEELYSEKAIDNKDPNYDSEELDKDIMYRPVVPEWNEDELIKTLQPMLREYFDHGQFDEVYESLMMINVSDRKYVVVVVLITLSMEMKNEYREMASKLIKRLFHPVPAENEKDIVDGKFFGNVEDLMHSFLELCDNLPELVLDTPDAPKVLGKFIARAISDKVLDNSALDMISETAAVNDDAYGRACVKEARLLLSIPHYNLSHVWGFGGGNQAMVVLRKKIKLLLEEYLSSGDSEEAIRCITELDVPHFNHEVVYEGAVMVIESGDERCMNMMVHLFKRLTDTGVVPFDQVAHGFDRVYKEMPDLSLDVPNAYQHLHVFLQKCHDLKVVGLGLMMNAPNKSRKRFVSEGDRRLFRGGAVDKFFDLA